MSMKKILVGLMAFLVIGMSWRFVFNNKKDKTQEEASILETTVPETKEVVFPIDNESKFETAWEFEAPMGVTRESTYITQTISIQQEAHEGEIILQKKGLLWQEDEEYTFSAFFDSDSEIALKIDVFFSEGDLFYSEELEFQGNTEVKFSLKSTKTNDWNGFIQIKMTPKEAQTIVMNEFRIIENNPKGSVIRLNHLGYLENERKRVIFPYNQGDFFDVVRVEDQKIVYTGAIVEERWNESAQERNYRGDFSSVQTPGKYILRSQSLGSSYEFEITDNIYEEVAKDALKMISLQRCGSDLAQSWAGNFAHEACHIEEAHIYDAQPHKLDVRGGWHDAGDYGRYVETGAKTAFDLLFAYQRFPNKFTDEVGIAESANGIPDILDEVRYELEWLLKLQTDWGGVYNKVTTPFFADDILPEEDKDELYILQVETMTTGDFAAVMAMASMIYEEYDADFAKQCLEASKKAWDNLNGTYKVVDYGNPGDFMTGSYRDGNDSDERFFASIALWSATQEEGYLNYAKEVLESDYRAAEGVSWSEVGAYGAYLFLSQEEAREHEYFYGKVLENLQGQVGKIVALIESDAYFTSLENYSWGSNGKVLNHAIILLMMSDLEGNEYYRELAAEQLNYIFGRNTLDLSFVSGYGYKFPENPHHRIAKIKKSLLKGALVGGVNSDRDDGIMQQIQRPIASMYLDQYESYSTNEVTIYWNSALVYVLSYFR